MSKKMQAQFLCSRIMLPEHRRELNRWHHRQEAVSSLCREGVSHYEMYDEQQREEFDRLVEESLRDGTPLSILVGGTNAPPAWVRGVVQAKMAGVGQLQIRTEEGLRLVPVGKVVTVQRGFPAPGR